MRLKKRSNTLELTAGDINEIFYPLQKGLDGECEENFLFLLDVNNVKDFEQIEIPSYYGDPRMKTKYKSFKELRRFLKEHLDYIPYIPYQK
jgi:hypothetical protein